MSSLEFEQNGKKEDDSSGFGILNVSEDSGTEVKDRDEQDGGYFDTIMEHNTEESTESIDAFIKKTTEKNEGKESEIRHTEKKDSVEDTHVYGSEEDSSYNLDEELEKESRVMDCESTDIELNDVSMGLSLQDTSEGEGDDVMISEETDDMLSDKIADDGMDSDDENYLIKSKGDDVIASEENCVTASEGMEGKLLLTGGGDDDMMTTEGGEVDVMHAKGRRDDAVAGEEEGRDSLMADEEKGKDNLLAGEGADIESIITGVGEGSGSLLDTEYVGRKKDIKFVKTSNVQIKVDVLDKKVGEAADLVPVMSGESGGSGSLSDTENRKQDDRKKETAVVKTSQVHMKVDVLDKTVRIVHSDDKDKITKSAGQKIENIGKSKENKVILKGEAENIDLKNEEVQGIAAESHERSNNNPDFQDMLASEDQKHNEKCIKSENGEEARESVNKIKVQVHILGKKKEIIEGTPDISTCDGQYNKVNADVQENKMNDTLKEQVNIVKCEDEVRKHKSKTAEEARKDREDAGERETMGIRVNLAKTDEESRNVTQTVEDDTVQKEAVKKEGEKIRVMSRNQNKDLGSDQCKDLDSLKKASRTQIDVGNKDETDADIHEISDTHEIVSADQQHVGGVLVKKTVSNIGRVKRKIEEILEKSKAEEDAFIEEIQEMKKEKTDILDKISSEMKKLKSLLVNEKQEEQEK